MKLTIEKVIYGGQGLARVPADSGPQSGMRVFLPFTLPGEVVEAQITEQHRGYCVAQVQRIERASEFRVAPPCEWFGICGGCQLQHSAYSFQVEMKRRILAESLTRAGVPDLPEIAIVSGGPLEYRNRIRLQVQTHPQFAIGYRQARSHRITAIDHCPIAAPLLQRSIPAIHSLAVAHPIPADLAEIELFTNPDESELLLTLWVAQRPAFAPKIATEFFIQLHKKIPQLTGAAVLATESQPGQGARPLLEWGLQTLQYRAAGRNYTVGIGSFFQINISLIDAFVSAVINGESGECAWDLYAGGGLFSAALAERFQRVLAVESSPASVKDLRKNLQGTSGVAINSTTLEFLQEAAHQREPPPDLVVLDPPRAGAGVEACRLLALCNPQRILYVSCDPATLGRDLAALIQSGYRLQRLQMVDMFPQTGHLETIATLAR
ncbi:MAG: 23S rRNA (uracil(1939)-C(5))-methyltransferase RlmD [Acidobacteriaceae bacterium]